MEPKFFRRPLACPPLAGFSLAHRALWVPVLLCAAPALLAQEPPAEPASTEFFSWSGSVAAGAEYNSNLSVAELESASGRSDVAATFEGGLTGTWQFTPKLHAEAGYNLTASRYQDIDAYDLDLHLLFTDVSYDFKLLTLGANYYYGNADLGGNDFLTLHQYSLYAGKLFGERWYVRGAFNAVDKAFDTIDTRDADNTGVSAEVYRFFNEGRSNVVLSYAYEDEDTRGTAFRYTADTLRLRVNHRFSLLGLDARAQAGLRWQDRDYGYITPSIGVPRDDSQRVAELRLDVNVLKQLTLLAGWQHGQYQSRLPSADYDENRVSLALQLTF